MTAGSVLTPKMKMFTASVTIPEGRGSSLSKIMK